MPSKFVTLTTAFQMGLKYLIVLSTWLWVRWGSPRLATKKKIVTPTWELTPFGMFVTNNSGKLIKVILGSFLALFLLFPSYHTLAISALNSSGIVISFSFSNGFSWFAVEEWDENLLCIHYHLTIQHEVPSSWITSIREFWTVVIKVSRDLIVFSWVVLSYSHHLFIF